MNDFMVKFLSIVTLQKLWSFLISEDANEVLNYFHSRFLWFFKKLSFA